MVILDGASMQPDSDLVPAIYAESPESSVAVISQIRNSEGHRWLHWPRS